MRKINILIAILLCLIVPAFATGQNLDKKVTLQYKSMTIEEIIKDITKKYDVKFSYSNNLLPLNKKVSLSVNNESLSAALHKLFKGTGITYQEVGTQIILKKSIEHSKTVPQKKQSEKVELSKADTNEIKEEITASIDAPAPLIKQDSVVLLTVPQYEELVQNDSTLDKQSLRKKYMLDKRRLRDQYYHKLDSLEGKGDSKNQSNLKGQFKDVMQKLKEEVHVIGDSLERINFYKKDSTAKENMERGADTSDQKLIPAQVTFVYPIGSNGAESPRYVNKLSLNILAGVNGGTEGFEFGSLLNVDKKYVKGIQLSGFGNLVGREMIGGQVSGFFNINGGFTNGFQAAGFMNLVGDSSIGFQFGGFMNAVSGSQQGGQFAGFTNFSRGNTYGTQFAGFLNIAGRDMYGVQAAGFLNVAGDDVRGAQIAGFMNVAPDTMRGVQIAGFMNVAKKVKGSQIGFINFADTVTGAQVGFISFSKGYRKLELWGSETLYGNVAFKTGSSHFYNIFAGGVRPKNNEIIWGFGYGIGTEIKISNKVMTNIEALTFNVHKDGFNWDELNLLNELRLNFGFKVAPKLTIFGGPVLNVTVSDHYNSDTGTIGSYLTPANHFFNRTYDKTNVAMWIGWNAGIRF